MEIKSQLIQILVQIPFTQTVRERRTLLTITGFDYLSIRISTIEQSNYVFFTELVKLIFFEGQSQLLRFIYSLKDSEFVGLETQNKLSDLVTKIETLEPQKWTNEFNELKENKTVNLIHKINQSAENCKKQQNAQLIVQSAPGTQAFEFAVVTINAQGQEIKSHQGQSHCLTEEFSDEVVLEMVYIPGGEFLMGSPESEGKRCSQEKSQHLVTVQAFFMSKFPITKIQWKQVAHLPEVRQKLKLRPSRQGGNNHPVTQVSWYDVLEFCDRLSQKTGYKYRLPSEAEWEYACRAGTTTPFHFGETINFNVANYDSRYPYRSEPKGIYRKKTTEVGSFQFANLFGLFEMHGLVWEWCLDNWHQNYDQAPINGEAWLDGNDDNTRVMRGGSWSSEAFMCRSSFRQFHYASKTLNNVGFRIVRSL